MPYHLATPALRHSTIAARSREKNSSGPSRSNLSCPSQNFPRDFDSEQWQSQFVAITARPIDREQFIRSLPRSQSDSAGHDEVTLQRRDPSGRHSRTRPDHLQQLLASIQAQVAPYCTLAGVAAGVLQRPTFAPITDGNQHQVDFLP